MRKTTNLMLHIALTLGICLSLTVAAEAAEFQVNSSADDQSDGCGTTVNTCTLREAVAAANLNAGADTLTFAPSVTSITLIAGDIVIGQALTIGSPTATALTTISGGGNGARIFTITADTTLNKLLFTGGNPGSGDGGAISNTNAVLTINESVVRDNSAPGGNGGGIFTSGGTVNLNRSTVGGATAGSNSAANGGGIYNLNGTVNLTNSTISNNSSGNIGGGYYGFSNLGTATLNSTSSTIAFNVATSGGGIGISSTAGFTSAATINNTIVSNNNAGTGPDLNANPVSPLLPGNIFSAGYNIIGNTAGTTITATTGDQFNTNPFLLPLANNGGLTPTHGLQTPASPAIDRGNTNQTVDQRGLPRTGVSADFPIITNTANGTDIGAFEAQVGSTSAEVTVAGRVKNAAGKGVQRALVILIDSSGTARTAAANVFGYYRFKNVNAGETYVMRASAKRYSFSTQIVSVNEDLSDMDFTAQP